MLLWANDKSLFSQKNHLFPIKISHPHYHIWNQHENYLKLVDKPSFGPAGFFFFVLFCFCFCFFFVCLMAFFFFLGFLFLFCLFFVCFLCFYYTPYFGLVKEGEKHTYMVFIGSPNPALNYQHWSNGSWDSPITVR